mmetsp:Transcript_38077/g.97408  ORF Transcript_38077/g.97408 Transcript_38077/m.97408 type:complete len:233 (-) Transcript_38077:1654-2352(-)
MEEFMRELSAGAAAYFAGAMDLEARKRGPAAGAAGTMLAFILGGPRGCAEWTLNLLELFMPTFWASIILAFPSASEALNAERCRSALAPSLTPSPVSLVRLARGVVRLVPPVMLRPSLPPVDAFLASSSLDLTGTAMPAHTSAVSTSSGRNAIFLNSSLRCFASSLPHCLLRVFPPATDLRLVPLAADFVGVARSPPSGDTFAEPKPNSWNRALPKPNSVQKTEYATAASQV